MSDASLSAGGIIQDSHLDKYKRFTRNNKSLRVWEAFRDGKLAGPQIFDPPVNRSIHARFLDANFAENGAIIADLKSMNSILEVISAR